MIIISSNEPSGAVNYVADAEADMNSLDTSALVMGSTCLIIGNGKVYMLTGDKTWKEL